MKIRVNDWKFRAFDVLKFLPKHLLAFIWIRWDLYHSIWIKLITLQACTSNNVIITFLFDRKETKLYSMTCCARLSFQKGRFLSNKVNWLVCPVSGVLIVAAVARNLVERRIAFYGKSLVLAIPGIVFLVGKPSDGLVPWPTNTIRWYPMIPVRILTSILITFACQYYSSKLIQNSPDLIWPIRSPHSLGDSLHLL